MLIKYKMAVVPGPKWETVTVEETAEIVREKPDNVSI